MHVSIDITAALYDRGVSRYTLNLARALAQRSDVSLRLYGSSWRGRSKLRRMITAITAPAPKKHHTLIQPFPPRLQEFLWTKTRLNSIHRLFPDAEVFHAWDWIQPPDTTIPLVSTIHDLAILKYPETAHPKILHMHQQAWKTLKQRRAQIIAVSHATKKDCLELLNFRPEDVHVVHEALPQETVRTANALTEEQHEALKLSLHLERPYLLCVGTREPRKNLERAIQAWWPLRERVDLLIAGEAGWDESTTLGEKLHSPHLRLLGKVSDQQLSVLYAEAELLLYPSLYEGFGLPILEAFFYGTPVITSNNSSMPEVSGNAAVLIDPHSVESIREGIELILNESLDAQRVRLQRMILRLQLFTWQRVAEETMKVYARAIEVFHAR